MRKILVVAKREYLASVRTKAFVISLVFMPIFMYGGMFLQKALKGRVDLEEKKLVVFDRTGTLFQPLLQAAERRNRDEIFDQQTGRQIEARYSLELGPAGELTDETRFLLSQRVRRHDIHAFAEIEKGVIQGDEGLGHAANVQFHSESEISNDLNRWFRRAVGQAVHAQRLQETGLDPALVAHATAPVEVDVLGLYSKTGSGAIKKADASSRTAATFIPLAVMLLMFMSLMMSQALLHSTLEEKQQKIAEVLLGSLSPFQLMLGKLLGNVVVSMTVVVVYLAGSFWMLDRMGYSELLPTRLLGWFFVFQFLGVLIFGSVFVGVGATCNDLNEARNYLMPVMMILVLPMMVWFKVLEQPMSGFATWLSFFPPATPMLMILRMAASGAVPMWQPVLGIATTLVATLICVWLAGRVFRVGLLMQGKPPRISELVRYAIRG